MKFILFNLNFSLDAVEDRDRREQIGRQKLSTLISSNYG